MATKIAINGFGRIGRQVTKAFLEKYPGEFDIVAVNDLSDVKTNAHLFKYDSNYGIFPGSVEVDGGDIVINGDRIKVLSERDPSQAAVGRYGRRYRRREHRHLHRRVKRPACTCNAGAKKVIISAPAKGEDITICMGVNNEQVRPCPAQYHQQRQLHHQLPGPGGQGRQRHLRHRAGRHDHRPRLHQ